MNPDQYLRLFGLMDEEGYLIPPDDPKLLAFRHRLFSLMESVQLGLPIGQEQKIRMKMMQIAFDAYNQELQDALSDLETGEAEGLDEAEDLDDDDTSAEEQK